MVRKVCVVSWTVPPTVSGSAVIVDNLSEGFSRDEMVVVGERPRAAPATERPDGLPEVRYIARELPRVPRLGRWLQLARVPLLARRIVRTVREEEADAIVAVFPDEAYLAAGYLAAQWTGAQLFPYYHNTYVENRSGLLQRLARWLEPRIFARATTVLVINEGLKEHFSSRSGWDCRVVGHAFNEAIPPFESPPEPGRPMSVVFSGSINESCRDALVRATAAVRLTGDTRMTFLTPTPEARLLELGLMASGDRCMTVDRTRLLHELQNADVLLLPHGFTGGLSPTEYRTIFPTKTIEYLISGRPILAHSPKGCFLTRFLKEHGCALVVEEPDAQAVAVGFARIRSDRELRDRLVRCALETARLFEASAVRRDLRRVLGLAMSRDCGVPTASPGGSLRASGDALAERRAKESGRTTRKATGYYAVPERRG